MRLARSASPLNLFHFLIAHLSARVGTQNPSNNRRTCVEFCSKICAETSINYASQGHAVQKDLSCLNLLFSRPSKNIVDIIAISSLLASGDFS